MLYVTAHPDDEHNGVLVRLSRGLGLRTALLTVTRGEGGQNAIGPELFEALGVLRTGELMALHRYDGVEQYFGRAYEFGYSFSVEETFEKWGREETLGDVVRVVRAFRPDVILTLPLEGDGRGPAPPGGRRGSPATPSGPPPTPPASPSSSRGPAAVAGAQALPGRHRRLRRACPATPVRVPTGVYDPLLGMTWQQLGSPRARAAPLPGHGTARGRPRARPRACFSLRRRGAAGERRPEADILDGVDTTLAGLARFAPGNASLATALAALERTAAAARAAFDAASPETRRAGRSPRRSPPCARCGAGSARSSPTPRPAPRSTSACADEEARRRGGARRSPRAWCSRPAPTTAS